MTRLRSLVSSRSGRLAASLALSVLLAAGCSSARQGDYEEEYPSTPGTDKADDPGALSCTGDETRCDGNVLRKCSGGVLKAKKTCTAGLVCDATYGCVQCSPRLPTQCDGDAVRSCDPGGFLGSVVTTCDPGMCKGGQCINTCGTNADLIYIVDDGYNLLSFNPRDGKNEIKKIGQLSCPAGRAFEGGTATPFSMSVDREANAWVLYNSGEIFWVSTKDATCKASGFMPSQKGFQTFGMGFVSDAVGSQNETLHITGGAYTAPGKGNLGRVDGKTLQVTSLGPLPNTEYGPELTGTGRAELWAYFPGTTSFIAQLDKTNGGTLQRFPLPSLTETVRAWAFAHWGGRFYVFVTTLDRFTGGNNSQVLLFDPSDGSTKTILDHLPYNIVGAGVSTCAPVVIG